MLNLPNCVHMTNLTLIPTEAGAAAPVLTE